MVRFRLLGAVELVREDGVAVRSVLTQPKRLALLAYLALENPGGFHRRDSLLALFWPESDERHARGALSQAVYFLRRSLGEQWIISRGDEEIGIEPSALSLDVREFRAALGAGRLEEAVELYRAELMHGFHAGASVAFEHWLDTRRTELKTAAADAAMLLVERSIASGAATAAVRWARCALAISPEDDRASRALATAEAEATLLSDVRASPAQTGPTPPRGLRRGQLDPPRRRRVLLVGTLVGVVLLAIAALREGFSQRVAGPSAGPDAYGPATIPEVRSLAILPLGNLSGDPAQEYFTDGITEALTAELGHIGVVKVISGTSAMLYRGSEKTAPAIARELGVDGLIEGSVLRAGDGVRITVRLVHGPTDQHLWSASYERDVQDVLALQREVVRNIVTEVQVVLSPPVRARLEAAAGPARAGGPHPRAYEAYLKGRYHFNRYGDEAFQTALQHYTNAVSVDPTFALAYAAMAELCVLPGIWYTNASDCRSWSITAVELDPQRAETQAAVAVTSMFDWDWKGAEAAFRRALELNPNSVTALQWYSQLLRLTMRTAESLEQIRRAEELDPHNLFVKTMVGWPLLNQRRYDEALAQWDDVLEMDPGYGLALSNQALVYWMQGDPARVFDRVGRARERLGEKAVNILLLTIAGHTLRGENDEAIKLLDEMKRRYPRAPGAIAAGHLALGQEEVALDWLEAGYQLRSPWLPNITSEPIFDPLRGHPRFRALRQRMGL